MKPEQWNARYAEGTTPWDTGVPSELLAAAVEQAGIAPCAALDIGCGTGTNAVWLAQRGFQVTGVDVASLAIEQANNRAAEAGVECRFLVGDFLTLALPRASFGFAFDRGCFHHCEDPESRAAFARRVAELLVEGGHWFSIIGSADGPPRDQGPPRRTLREIVEAAEPWFEFLRVEATLIDSPRPDPPGVWACLLRRRAGGEKGEG
jgi:SAM-dependent methyltransferase